MILLHPKPLEISLSSSSCQADGAPQPLKGFLTPFPLLPLSGLGCDCRHLHLLADISCHCRGSKWQFSMQTSPLTLPCSAAEPCPVLSFAQCPAVGWLWITSASVAHRIRWDRGFKNKLGPAINKEKTPVMHPVSYPSSLLEDNIG